MNDQSTLNHRHPVSTVRRRATLMLRFMIVLAVVAVFALANKTPSRVRAMTPAETAAFKEFISFWETQDICWKSTTTRGVGTIPTECPGKDKDAGLCYDKCPAGMYGVGPVCWQECPAGYTNTGGHCSKPAPYGRGAGYPWQFGDALNDSGMFERCEKDSGKGGCERTASSSIPSARRTFMLWAVAYVRPIARRA